MVNSKHIATFVLGVAAGLAAAKYNSMSDEDKEKLAENLKAKANGLKEEAEATMEKAKGYFEELRTKGATALEGHVSEAEKFINELFGHIKPTTDKPADTTTPA
jgi:hypothetical protein